MDWAETRDRFDEVVEDNGVKVLIDPKAVLFLLGTEMDYQVDKLTRSSCSTTPTRRAPAAAARASSSRPAPQEKLEARRREAELPDEPWVGGRARLLVRRAGPRAVVQETTPSTPRSAAASARSTTAFAAATVVGPGCDLGRTRLSPASSCSTSSPQYVPRHAARIRDRCPGVGAGAAGRRPGPRPGLDARAAPVLYLPFEHSENAADQATLGRACSRRSATPSGPASPSAISEIIARFGRFPHRNAIWARLDAGGAGVPERAQQLRSEWRTVAESKPAEVRSCITRPPVTASDSYIAHLEECLAGLWASFGSRRMFGGARHLR